MISLVKRGFDINIPLHTPLNKNGLAERKNWTLMDMARSI
jgi:hypothetical protein